MATATELATTPEFRDLCERFRALEARKSGDEARANFAQAQLIRDARERLRVPVAAICDALDLSSQSVNTYRNVAERIDEGLFEVLVEQRRADGLPLFPWSIIAQVARLAERRDRENLIKEIRLRGWRTREVQGYVSVERTVEPRRFGRPENGAAALAARMEALLGELVARATPTLALAIVAESASRLIAAAARGSERDPSAPAHELLAARDALAHCEASASEARESIQRHIPEAHAFTASPVALDGEDRRRANASPP